MQEIPTKPGVYTMKVYRVKGSDGFVYCFDRNTAEMLSRTHDQEFEMINDAKVTVVQKYDTLITEIED